ncbi:TPA: hypothetical protein QB591_000779 [Pasteurella multocida]|nr:hypothetical protein [Pasteurella multocida]
MKRLGLILLLSGVLIAGCSEEKGKPTYQEMEAIKLAFFKITPPNTDLAVQCDSKKIGERYYAACNFMGVGKRTNLNIFLYNNEKDSAKRFYALNGPAMTTYDNHFKNETVLGSYKDTFGLPMEPDINLSTVNEQFNHLMK